MVDSGLVDRYLRQSLYGNKTKFKKEPIASPLEVEDVKGHFMMLMIGLTLTLVTEFLRTFVRSLVPRWSLRTNQPNAAPINYTVKLMVSSDLSRIPKICSIVSLIVFSFPHSKIEGHRTREFLSNLRRRSTTRNLSRTHFHRRSKITTDSKRGSWTAVDRRTDQ